ncbi:glucose-dependent insulinotropic receptor-like [Liolophura sinensis]|uniref:glucose-dependent insulinotropic receptor-like n=1 Tax=Liolophura sinensis TaxID=3198878 RepID=UPI003158E6F8
MILPVESVPSNHSVVMILATTPFLADSITTNDPVNPNNFHEQLKVIILVPVTILIILSNLVVLFYIMCHKQLHKPTYLFVASLGIADLFVGCVCIGSIVHPNDPVLELCLVRMGFVISACVASLYCMTWIAIDRYIAIIYPLRYPQKMTVKRACFIIVCIWTGCFLIGFAPLTGWNVGVYHQYCSFSYIMSPTYLVFLFVSGFVLPMLVIIIVYWRLFEKARVHFKRILAIETVIAQNEHADQRSYHTGHSHRNWKSVRILMVLIGCFTITWCPFMVTAFTQAICGDDTCHLKDIIGSYLLLLGFSNSFLNPIIYAVSNQEFQTDVL